MLRLARVVKGSRFTMSATSEKEQGAEAWSRGPGAQRLRRMVERALPGAQIVAVSPMAPDAEVVDESVKGGGYGAPLRLDVTHAGEAKSLVLHLVTSNQFGHDRRADRASEVLLAADTFASIPQHVKVLDVGAYRGNDDFVSLSGTGEFYLLTSHAEGHVYADDLRRIARAGSLTPLDYDRHGALLDFLAVLHAERPKGSKATYVRAIRDMVGSGEGVFGIADDYPDDVPGASRQRLERLEAKCLEWRFRLRDQHERLRRVHGDFHPFTVLFSKRSQLSVLDASRGSVGEPADDVTCMAINYAFFSLGHPGSWRGALRALWRGFWEGYLSRTGDDALLEVAAPFLAWRGLVLASPTWYPELRAEDRDRLLGFVERTLEAVRFSPQLADEFFGP
jgi:hypothetical protein